MLFRSECKKETTKEIYDLVNDLELTDDAICDNVVDTGNEWEVFDIVEIGG